MGKEKKIIKLEIQGIGIIMYSPFSVAHIREGDDYLEIGYEKPGDVLKHVYNGSIVGFGTGSPGNYILKIYRESPNEVELEICRYKLRLGIEVKDEKIVFRDLYDLMEWNPISSSESELELENGFYRITLCSKKPSSGVWGDNQEINFYFEKVNDMPLLKFDGVPTLCF